MVRPRSSIRTSQHASIRIVLLSTRHGSTVCRLLRHSEQNPLTLPYRPYDVRLWQAQGASYEEIGRPQEAIECFKRALLGSDANEISIDLKIAKLHNDLNQYTEAVKYHMRVIDLSVAARTSCFPCRPSPSRLMRTAQSNPWRSTRARVYTSPNTSSTVGPTSMSS